MKLKDAFRRAMLSVGCEDCMAMAQAAGVEPGDCGSCDEECRACAERAADALAGRMMPEGTEWPRFGHIRWREKVVRCRDCARFKEFPQGGVCTLRGSAGWFATEPEGFCWLGKEREDG